MSPSPDMRRRETASAQRKCALFGRCGISSPDIQFAFDTTKMVYICNLDMGERKKRKVMYCAQIDTFG